jgi:sugar/nucleoside kinase (ribokinase family)
MPTAPRFDVLAIGNAIVDVVAPVPEAFLAAQHMRKGGMALIDAHAADTLYAALPPGRESSGGSAANTAAVAAMLGTRAAYMGKVAEDTPSPPPASSSRPLRWPAAPPPRAA